MPEGVRTRWASPENPKALKGAAAQSQGGRKGSPNLPVPAGAQIVLAEASGTSGVVRRLWVTISDRTPPVMRGLRIDIYWDGAATPAVSAPFADFFGQSLGRCQIFQSAYFSNPENKSFNCCVPMPFKSAFKIVLTNESGIDFAMLFYDVNFTVGDKLDESTLYLHAHWRRENPTALQQDYEFLPRITGRGRFLGVNVGVICDSATYHTSWWGEGECKVYLDGDEQYPTLAGTGTEDYLGTAWGQGQYSHLYQGCTLCDHEKGQYAFYRFHVPDPIYFYEDIRVTMQQIGCWDPKTIKRFAEEGYQLIVNGPRPGARGHGGRRGGKRLRALRAAGRLVKLLLLLPGPAGKWSATPARSRQENRGAAGCEHHAKDDRALVAAGTDCPCTPAASRPAVLCSYA